MVDRVRLGLRALFRRGVIEREMDDEIRLHLERATERLVRRGLSPEQARATARREFGNVEYLKEEGRDARGGRWLEDTVSDIRYGLRGLKKTPVFTTVALTSLILGIGVNTALFTMLKVAFRPSPVAEPATLVEARVNLPYPVFEEIRARSPSLVDVFARSTERLAIRGVNASEEPARVTAELVTSEFFRALRGVPLLGRTFASDEATVPGREPVAVLSYRMWRSRFGDDSAVIGRSLQLASGTTLTIVGVMPLEFTGADRHTPDFWIPMTMRGVLPATYQIAPVRHAWFTDPTHGWLRLGGRLREGATASQVRSQIDAALRASDTTGGRTLQHDDVTTADGSGITASEWVPVSLVALATFLVLLIACANVANLMLARAAARRRGDRGSPVPWREPQPPCSSTGRREQRPGRHGRRRGGPHGRDRTPTRSDHRACWRPSPPATPSSSPISSRPTGGCSHARLACRSSARWSSDSFRPGAQPMVRCSAP